MNEACTDAELLGLPAEPDADDLVRAVVGWHFDPATGSRFWLDRAAGLDFDPRRDIRGVADLPRFPDVSQELTWVPVGDLVPRGCTGEVRVFESGGTLGRPKRVIEVGSRARALSWVGRILRAHRGSPPAPATAAAGRARPAGNWLHVGPTGPHLVGRSVGLLAAAESAICHYLDFDPRWVRRCLARGERDTVDGYLEHVLDQVATVLDSQQVSTVVITPPVLEAACARPELEKLLAARVRTLIWTGTTMSEETLRTVRDDVLPDTTVIGLYGNTLMGIAPQRPPQPGDPASCVFLPYHPYAVVQVVDPGTGTPVPPLARGRVRVDLLTRDLFLPNVLERDSAVRVPAAGGYGEGLAGLRPYRATGVEPIIEGVY